MSEYIDRESISNVLSDVCSDKNCPMYIAATVTQMIYYEPAADVAPVVHSSWAYRNYYAPSDAECDICGFEYDTTRFGEFKYCPNCGAKMDGGGA